MKSMKKKLSLALVFFIVLTVTVPMSASAAEDIRSLNDGYVTVLSGDGDVTVTGSFRKSAAERPSELYGNAAIEIEPGYTGTLTLRDVDILIEGESPSQTAYAIRNEKTERRPTAAGFTINLEGENKVTSTTGSIPVVLYNTTITGDGSMEVSGATRMYNGVIDADFTSRGSIGIRLTGPDNEIKGGDVVFESDDPTYGAGCAIEINRAMHYIGNSEFEYENTRLSITGGNVKAIGGSSAAISLSGIEVELFVGEEGSLEAVSEEEGSHGIITSSNNQAVVIEGTVVATGAQSGLSASDLTLSESGSLTATATGDSGESDMRSGSGLIYSGQRLEVAGTLNATGADGMLGGVGIFMRGMGDGVSLHVASTGSIVARGGATKALSAPGILGHDSSTGIGEAVEAGISTVTQYSKDAGAEVSAYAGANSQPAYSVANAAGEGYKEITGFADAGSGSPPAAPSTQTATSDTPTADNTSSWAVEQVTAATEVGLVPIGLRSSYTQATTRAEFCALAVALYETATGGEITDRSTFTDTTDINVEKAAAIGVVSGVGDNMFSPDTQLTREQAATMLSRLAEAVGKPLEASAATFADNDSISDWAAGQVGQIQAAGIMSGVGNNTFAPQDPYTREQSIITIMRLYDLIM